MNRLTDKVVAYRPPDEGEKEMYGLCIRREGHMLRVMALQKEDNREAPLKSVLRKLSGEDGLVSSQESRLASLQTKLAKERNAGGQSKTYRLQKTMLHWASHRLEGVDTEEWLQLAQEHHPSAVVKTVGCAAASIATNAKLVSSSWTDAQKLFGKGEEVPAMLRRAGEQRMNETLYNALEEVYIADSSLSYALVVQESPLLGILHKWITSLVDYQRARYMEDGEADLLHELAGCQNSLQSAKQRRGALMKQAELINMGNCYIRTQTVRSVPMDCVLYLMKAEKVTTRHYLLTETSLTEEFAGEAVSRSRANAKDAHAGQKKDATATTTTTTRNGSHSAHTADSPVVNGNRTNDGVPIPPIPIPKIDFAGVGARTGDRAGRSQPSLEKEAGSTNGSSTVKAVAGKRSSRLPRACPATVATDVVSETPVHVANGVHRSGAASSSPPSPLIAASPATPLMNFEVASLGEPSSSQSRVLSARPGGTEPMQVLTDVRNNFQNVQAVLLACLEDYQKLEDKYASTVEHSKQLLQTLESRDRVIVRLQRELTAACAGQTTTKKVPTKFRDGYVSDDKKRRNVEDVYPNGFATLSTTDADRLMDGDSFEQRFEQMLYDTLEFLQGAESIPSVYESEPRQE